MTTSAQPDISNIVAHLNSQENKLNNLVDTQQKLNKMIRNLENEHVDLFIELEQITATNTQKNSILYHRGMADSINISPRRNLFHYDK